MDFNGLPEIRHENLLAVALVTIVILAVWKLIDIFLWIANHVTLVVN